VSVRNLQEQTETLRLTRALAHRAWRPCSILLSRALVSSLAVRVALAALNRPPALAWRAACCCL
jgi:hypothetical protein